MKRLPQWLLKTTIPDWIIALAAVIGIVVAIQQTRIIGLQRRDGIEAGRQTDAIRRALESSAKASQGSAESMRKTAGYARGTLEQSKKTLERTIEMSWDQQRAWVGAVRPHGEAKEGFPLNVTVTFKNYGLSPAMNLKQSVTLTIQPPGRRVAARRSDPTVYDSCSALPPGEEVYVTATWPGLLTKADVDAIRLGKVLTVFVYGRADYDDSFGRPHHTLYEYRLEATRTTWAATSEHNEMK